MAWLNLLWTSLWTSASAPRRFFGWLEHQPPRLFRGGLVAYLSLLTLGLVAAFGFSRATQSNAALLLGVVALVGSSAFFAWVWAFGSVFVQRPGTLDLRAWEVTGWSWTPALFGSATMLVPILVLPAPALAVTFIGVLIWHLVTLRAGLVVFLGVRATRIVTIYALYLYALPVFILGLVVWLTLQV